MAVDSLKKALKKPPRLMKSKQTQKCIHFANKMKKMGLIHSIRSTTPSPNSSFEQLKLLSSVELPKK